MIEDYFQRFAVRSKGPDAKDLLRTLTQDPSQVATPQGIKCLGLLATPLITKFQRPQETARDEVIIYARSYLPAATVVLRTPEILMALSRDEILGLIRKYPKALLSGLDPKEHSDQELMNMVLEAILRSRGILPPAPSFDLHILQATFHTACTCATRIGTHLSDGFSITIRDLNGLPTPNAEEITANWNTRDIRTAFHINRWVELSSLIRESNFSPKVDSWLDNTLEQILTTWTIDSLQTYQATKEPLSPSGERSPIDEIVYATTCLDAARKRELSPHITQAIHRLEEIGPPTAAST